MTVANTRKGSSTGICSNGPHIILKETHCEDKQKGEKELLLKYRMMFYRWQIAFNQIMIYSVDIILHWTLKISE